MTGSNGHPILPSLPGHDGRHYPEGVPTPEEMASLTREDHLVIEELVGNAIASRQEWIRGVMADPRRNLNKECGFPEPGRVSDQVYANLYERDPLAARVVQVMARESWQVSPLVYETEDAEQVTEWERAWDELGRQLRAETSYHAQEQGSLIWKYLEDADVLSGIDHYAIILLGLDDGRPLHEPVEGWEEFFSVPVESPGRKKRGGAGKSGNANGPEFADTTQTTYGTWGGGGDPGPAVYNSRDEAAINDSHARNLLVLNGQDPAAAPPSADPSPETPPPVGPYSLTVNARKTKGRKLLYMSVFPETLAPVATYESNPSSPRFMQPTTYDVTFNDPRTSGGGVSASQFSMTRQVHWTRVVHVADTHHQATSSKVFAFPRMEPVLNVLLSAQKVWSAGAEGYWQSCFTTLSFETHPQLGGDVKVDKAKLKAMMYEVRNRLQRDVFTSGMAVKSIAPSVVDMTPFVETLINLICIKLGIPVRIFKGSERGELASTQDDAAWNDRVKQRQQSYLTPCVVVPVIDRLINVGVLPKPKAKLSKPEAVAAKEGEDAAEPVPEAEVEEGVKEKEAVTNVFNPRQLRDDLGRWKTGSGTRAEHDRVIDEAVNSITGGQEVSRQETMAAIRTALKTHGEWKQANPYAEQVRQTQNTDDRYQMKFDVGGKGFVFEANREGKRWDVEFQLTDWGAANSGQAANDPTVSPVEVLGKVGYSLSKFVQARSPNEVTFTATKAEPGRVKLYSRLARNVGETFGYSVLQADEGDSQRFVLKKQPTANVGFPPKAPKPATDVPADQMTGDAAEAQGEAAPAKPAGRPMPPPEAEEEPGYKIEWPDITSQSKEEKAAYAAQMATALSTYAGPGAAPTIVAPFDFLTEFGELDESRVHAILENSEEHKAKQEADAQQKQKDAIEKGLVADPVKEQEAKIEALKSGKAMQPGQPGGGGGKPGAAGGAPAKPTPGFPAGRGPTLNEGLVDSVRRAARFLHKHPDAMPGYGQVFLKGTEVWYVGGDGDERGFDKLVKLALKVPGVTAVRYESEGFPPENRGWERVDNSADQPRDEIGRWTEMAPASHVAKVLDGLDKLDRVGAAGTANDRGEYLRTDAVGAGWIADSRTINHINDLADESYLAARERVDPADLVFTQEVVERDTLRSIVASGEVRADRPVKVFEDEDGTRYLLDGHTRASAALLLSQGTVAANIWRAKGKEGDRTDNGVREVTANEAKVVIKDLAAYLHGLIDDVTLRDARNIARAVKLGVEEGMDDEQVANLLKKVLPEEDFNDYRTKLIATTEMTRARGELLLANASKAGEDSVRFVAHPDCCDDCQRLNGKEFSLKGITVNSFDPNQARDENGRWTVTLYRAAKDDTIVDTASFSPSRETAEKYLDNPGFGGPNMYRAKVEISKHEMLDLFDMDEESAFQEIERVTGKRSGRGMGVDEYVSRYGGDFQAKGIQWVRHRESYPEDGETFTYVGTDEPELVKLKLRPTTNARPKPASGVIPVHPGCRCRWDRGADPLTGNADQPRDELGRFASTGTHSPGEILKYGVRSGLDAHGIKPGTHKAEVIEHAGRKYLVKDKSSDDGSNEQIVSEWASRHGLPVPRTFDVRDQGKDRVLTELVEGKALGTMDKKTLKQVMSKVSDAELSRHLLLDYVIGNNDNHLGNYLAGPDGLVAIDKATAFSQTATSGGWKLAGHSLKSNHPRHQDDPAAFRFDKAEIHRAVAAADDLADTLTAAKHPGAEEVRKRADILRWLGTLDEPQNSSLMIGTKSHPRPTINSGGPKHEPAGSSKGGQFVSQGSGTPTKRDQPHPEKGKTGDAPTPPGTGAAKGKAAGKFATPQDIEAGRKKQIKPGVDKVTTADGKSYAVKQRETAEAGGNAEKQVSDMAQIAGVNVPRTEKQTVNGKPAVVTEWAEGGDLKSMTPEARKKFLQSVPKEQIDKHTMFDYLLGHGDTHNGNFIAGTDGSLVGIDKELWGHNGGHGKGTKFDIPQFVADVTGGYDTMHKFDRKHVEDMIAAGEKMATAPGISPKDAQGIRNRVAVLKKFAEKPDAELTTGELWSAGQRGVPSAGGFLGKMKGMFGGGPTGNAFDQSQPRDEQGRWVVYHGTADTHLKTIMERGIVPGEREGADALEVKTGGGNYKATFREEGRDKSVYLSTDASQASVYGAKAVKLHGSKPVVLEVRIPADQMVKDDEAGGSAKSKRFEGTIRPEWITGVLDVDFDRDELVRRVMRGAG